VADPPQHPEGRLRQKASEGFPKRVLVLDLIAIAHDDCHGHRHRIKPRGDVLDHVSFGPGPLGGSCASQRVLDHLFAKFGQ